MDILYNSDVEWHEAFSVLLGPEDPEGAMFGPITMATITILDNEVSGSLVLPASPVVSHILWRPFSEPDVFPAVVSHRMPCPSRRIPS